MQPKLTKYERAFVEDCKKLKIRVEKDEDGCPIAKPRTKGYKKIFTMTPWGTKKVAIMIQCEHKGRKKKMIDKISSKISSAEIFIEGDTEAIVLIARDDMENIKRPLKFFRERIMTEEQKVAITERLAKAREMRGNKNA